MTSHGQAVIDKYLSRYALLPARPALKGQWQQVMVIPCFQESPDFLQRVPKPIRGQALLVICLLNRPDTCTDPSANSALRTFIQERATAWPLPGLALCSITSAVDVLLVDLDRLEGPIPHKEGVGRVRRIGCDLALWLMQQERVKADWIHSCDADAQWPARYLTESWPLDAAAVSLPFQHVMHAETALGRATLVYELWLHDYVSGLESARSPYAFHTLGSCCSFSARCYAAVRGVPLRAGAEDFYLLNKLAKVGRVHRPAGPAVLIQARASDRVPFGTGPAVQRLMATSAPETVPFFYHPHCFTALNTVLEKMPTWVDRQTPAINDDLAMQLPVELAGDAAELLDKLGIVTALRHAKRQGGDKAQRARQLHTWFDGFKTLKFINGLGDRQGSHLTLEQLQAGHSSSCTPKDLLARRAVSLAAWGWHTTRIP